MTAKSSKGLKICITPATPASSTPIVPTAIAIDPAVGNAPAGVKVTAANTFAVGEIVSFSDTGFSSLDGKSFAVTSATATNFTIGALVLGTGTLGTSPKVAHYAESEMTCLCLSSLSIQSETPGVISVATFCDPSASLPASGAAAGTLNFAGYVDVTAKDYPALVAAVEDGKQRVIRIMLPSNGYITAPVTISSLTWDLPLDGGIGFSGSATLASKAVHVW
jgi:hypothetical protein